MELANLARTVRKSLMKFSDLIAFDIRLITQRFNLGFSFDDHFAFMIISLCST